jgi:hypothetical protein
MSEKNPYGCLSRLADEIVTVSSIASITYLGANGVTDAAIIGAVAGLGGYRIYNKKRNK